jgi:hypothetical protein
MPRGPTEIPHFAFTHHRIGIHQPTPAATATQADSDELVLIPGSPVAAPLDELRNRGLGYLQVSDATAHMSRIPGYRAQAEQLLLQFKRDGGKDSEADAALARLQWGVDPQKMLPQRSGRGRRQAHFAGGLGDRVLYSGWHLL